MKTEQKHPAEMTGREFLYEQGYKMVMEKNGYKAEFDRVKEVLPSISGFANLPEFIKAVENDPVLTNAVVKDLVKLWQDNYELRPATGTILLFAIWNKLSDFGRREFGNLCGDVFLVLEDIKVDASPDIIQALFGALKASP